jgi:hypothetical protein
MPFITKTILQNVNIPMTAAVKYKKKRKKKKKKTCLVH